MQKSADDNPKRGIFFLLFLKSGKNTEVSE